MQARTTAVVADTAGLTDAKAVQRLQDEAQLLLFQYVRRARAADDQWRFGQLLLTVPSLSQAAAAASSAAVVTLLFADAISATQAERIVVDIYRQLSAAD